MNPGYNGACNACTCMPYPLIPITGRCTTSPTPQVVEHDSTRQIPINNQPTPPAPCTGFLPAHLPLHLPQTIQTHPSTYLTLTSPHFLPLRHTPQIHLRRPVLIPLHNLHHHPFHIVRLATAHRVSQINNITLVQCEILGVALKVDDLQDISATRPFRGKQVDESRTGGVTYMTRSVDGFTWGADNLAEEPPRCRASGGSCQGSCTRTFGNATDRV